MVRARNVLLGARRIPYAITVGTARVIGLIGGYAWLRLKAGRRIVRTSSQGGLAPQKVVMLVISMLDRDPRVERAARTLAASGYEVEIVCPEWWEEGERNLGRLEWGERITFRAAPRSTGRFILGFPYLFGWRFLRFASAIRGTVYHAHDLSTTLVGLLAAAKHNAFCICDFHEWYAENVSYDRRLGIYRPHSLITRLLFQKIERLALHSATAVVTVCDSIADAMAARYRSVSPIHVIRNIPLVDRNDGVLPPADLRSSLGISSDKLIVLYQGGLGPTRNLEPVIEAMMHTPKAVLILRGPGYVEHGEQYLQWAKRVGVSDRVFCLPPVPSQRVVAEARAADIGLWTLLANVGLNFRYALGNKIFEYLAAGLPILAADLPEARKLVLGHAVGLCFDPDSPSSIASAINCMTDDRTFYSSCRSNIGGAWEANRADHEWKKLITLYQKIEPRAHAPVCS